jgi:hypothetical protein
MCLFINYLHLKDPLLDFGMGHALKEMFSVSQALALKQSLGIWEFLCGPFPR